MRGSSLMARLICVAWVSGLSALSANRASAAEGATDAAKDSAPGAAAAEPSPGTAEVAAQAQPGPSQETGFAPAPARQSESSSPPRANALGNEALALPSSDSFSNEDASEAEQQHRLDLYGFADLTYTRLLVPKSSAWNRFYSPLNSFAVGNFNLYLSSNLGDSWRTLGEVRFLYLPNGATTTNASTGQIQRTDTTVLDYANFEAPIHWGAIAIERLWVEHEFSSLFKLQAGAFLTPYGIWNVDHGSPAIIGIRAPFAVVGALFPAHQTGLQLYGNTYFDPLEVGYHLTLSNGRGAVEYQDFADDKAVGGRLYLKTEALGSLTLGTSAYRGGYYDRSAQYVVSRKNGQSLVDQAYTTIAKYEEFSFGADLKWEWKHWLVQGEFIMNEVAHAAGGRPRATPLEPPQGFSADYRRWGAYGLLGYRTRIVQTMPYVMVQYVYAPDNPVVPPVLGAQFGLNIRPTPAVVLKLEFTATHFSGPGSAGLGLSPLRILATQLAWAF
jgi:hypothetical protein